ncbi:MAG: magnesium transporter [Clostridia bacterium]|nr:magnesium transporter [Clostridia bacterium]
MHIETEIEELITDTIVDLLTERKFSELKSIISEMNPADIALVMSELPEERIAIFFRLLPKDLAAETFVEIDTDMQEDLIHTFSDAELREVFNELYVDDTVDILEEMPAGVVKRILKNTDKETRHVINELLQYPEDSAGSIMTTEYVRLNSSLTVSDALAVIRRSGVEKETIYTCYVTDNNRIVTGIVTARMLLTSSPDKIIEDIMETNVIVAKTTDDKESVATALQKYDFVALPVVDDENRLVGIVTIDDAIDVLQEEATEDIEKMAAITPTEKPYLKMGTFGLFLSRIPWLLLLMITATFTGMIITGFESSLASQAVLIAFITMLMGTGGNSGSQSSVTIIRALSLEELKLSDIFRVIWKEVRTAILCGSVLALACFAKIWLVDRMLLGNSEITVLVDAVVCISMFITVLVAKVVGAILPMLAQAVKLDPAVMASPFITSIVDVLSLIVYFRVATLLLGI